VSSIGFPAILDSIIPPSGGVARGVPWAGCTIIRAARGGIVDDFRLTLRGLSRWPGYAVTVIFSLALGIGANTAIFSLVDQVLLRPLPVRDPGDLVFLYQPGPLQGTSSTDEGGGPSFSYPLFRGLQEQQTPFSGLAGARTTSASLFFEGESSSGIVHRVSGNYFAVLGVKAAFGRLLEEADDDTRGTHPVAVLSHRYWTSRWTNDPSVLNRTINVNGQPMTIVGVAERGFDAEQRGVSVDVFVPISMNREIVPAWNGFEDRRDHWVTLFGRLKPGLTLEAAAHAVNEAYRAQLEEDIADFGGRSEDYLVRYRAKRIVLRPGQWGRGGMRDEARSPLLVLAGMTLLVLSMACANVTSLLLARGAARAREIALRLALGASRLRLMRQLLTESLVLAGAAGLLGLLVAHWTLPALLDVVPSGDPTLLSVDIDWRTLSFCLCLSAATSVLFGLYPAVQASRPDLVASLKAQSEATAAGTGGLFRRSLLTAQVAVSLGLLCCAGLCAKTFLSLTRLDLGMQADNLITFSIEPKLNRYTDAQAAAFYDALTDRLATLPGVALVSAARVPSIAGHASSGQVTVEGFTPQDEDASNSSFNLVGPDYFRTMGIPLVAGRELTRADDARAPKVAVVNEAFVRHFLGGRDALGRRFGWGVGKRAKLDIEIVGVVRDAKYSSLREAPSPVYYASYRQRAEQSRLHLYVRTAADPKEVAPLIRRGVAGLDANLPVRDLKTMRHQIEENLGTERLLAVLTGSFAGLAVVLAAIGLYGVLAYDVARRTREIGIRMALGAQAAQVRGLVVRQVAWTLAIGMTAGIAAAATTGRLLQAFLFGTTPLDPRVYAFATVLVVVMALTAAYVPARRATRVDPMVALRDE
jgi:predicted permease